MPTSSILEILSRLTPKFASAQFPLPLVLPVGFQFWDLPGIVSVFWAAELFLFAPDAPFPSSLSRFFFFQNVVLKKSPVMTISLFLGFLPDH